MDLVSLFFVYTALSIHRKCIIWLIQGQLQIVLFHSQFRLCGCSYRFLKYSQIFDFCLCIVSTGEKSVNSHQWKMTLIFGCHPEFQSIHQHLWYWGGMLFPIWYLWFSSQYHLEFANRLDLVSKQRRGWVRWQLGEDSSRLPSWWWCYR